MPTTNFTCNKDARIARRESDNYDSGAGTGDGLAYGLYQGYRYRALLGFSINMAGWTSITSATFHYKSSNQINVAFGSDPTMLIQRITQSWSEGTQSALSSSNGVIYPGPSATSTNHKEEDAPTTENTWGSEDITMMMRDALAAGVFYGIRLLGSTNESVESDSASNVGEIYSRESGSGTAYIAITYETNRAPNVPTVSSPDVANGGLTASQTPTLNVNMTDPDGNAINNYRWQIDDNSDFSSPIQDVTVGSGGANGFTAVVIPAALSRGGTYYFRAQAADVSVWGGWSTTFSFKVASLPSLTVTEPSAAGRLARIQYDAASGWVSPRMVVNWGMTCPDGGTQASWRVEVLNDNLSVFNDSGTVGDTQSARIVPANLTEGAYYHVRVTATCSHGLTAVVGTTRVRARWGVVTHRYDMGVAPGSLALTTLDATDGAQGKVVVEYMTTTGAAPTTWASSIGGAGLNQFFYYRTWLLIWGTSPAVSPTLNQLKITYSTAIITPDKWTLQDPANASGDAGTFVFGTQSLRMKGKGSTHQCYQSIPVVPNTNYILSARIQTQGDPLAAVVFSVFGTGGGTGVGTPTQAADILFEDPRSRLSSGIWNSGSNSSIFVRCIVSGPVGSTAHFDAIKVEASTVVTPWSPGYIADAVVLDAGGMQIDASSGGIFRLKAATGGARDIVELGSRGLKFGGDTEVYSPSSGTLSIGDDAVQAGRLAVAGGPSGSEGGEIQLVGAAANTDWNIDNYGGQLRMFDAAVRLAVQAASPQVQVNGDLNVTGNITSGLVEGGSLGPPIIRVYTGNATWTKPAGLRGVQVEVQGGGSGAGGCVAGTGGSHSGAGSAGGYCRSVFSAAELPASVAVVVGGGGGGVASGLSGVGGTSSFIGGSINMVAGGGSGSNSSTATSSNQLTTAGSGGTASGGDINIPGGDGGNGVVSAGTRVMVGLSGGSPLSTGVKVSTGAGIAGHAYGGGGGACATTGAAASGGSGAAGVVIVTEYY